MYTNRVVFSIFTKQIICQIQVQTKKARLSELSSRAAQGTRTLDLRITNALLYQLS